VAAQQLARRGCDGGDPLGCNNLGWIFQQGESTTGIDLPRAAVLYERACQAENAQGCSNLGNLLIQGMGVNQDTNRGVELLRKGCKLGNEWGCHELSRHGHQP
jgi:TPR repeat protein